MGYLQGGLSNWQARTGDCRGSVGAQPAGAASNGGLTGRLTEVALGYQRTLLENPCDAKALAGMSLVALASRQPQAAVRMAEAAVSAAPEMVAAWVTLGQAQRVSGQVEESERAYRQAIRLDGRNALALIGLGELKIASVRA